MEIPGRLWWNYLQWYLLHRIPHPSQNIWEHRQNSDGDWFLHTNECRTCMMAWRWWESGSSAAQPIYKCASIHRISRTTGTEERQLWRVLHHDGCLSVSPPKSITSYWEIMPPVYNFVNVCNHGYTFCVTLVLPTKICKICWSSSTKIKSITFLISFWKALAVWRVFVYNFPFMFAQQIKVTDTIWW
jgi:hypothetical protein